MTKIIITKIENVRRVEEIKYIIDIPQNIKNINRYIKKFISDNDYSIAKIISQKTIDGEFLDEDVSDVKIRYSKNN